MVAENVLAHPHPSAPDHLDSDPLLLHQHHPPYRTHSISAQKISPNHQPIADSTDQETDPPSQPPHHPPPRHRCHRSEPNLHRYHHQPRHSKDDLSLPTDSSSRRRARKCRSDSLGTERFRSNAFREHLTSLLKGEMSLNLSFCGCGFLGMYHMGVAACLIKHGPTFLSRLDRVAGASAGALVAALLVTAPSLDKVQSSVEMVSILAKDIRKKPLGSLTPGYRLSDKLYMVLDRILPPDAHELACGKLFLSLTHAKTRDNLLFSDFQCREELLEALVASCHIPFYSGMKMPKLKGKHYFDGGFSDNMVRFKDGRTVTVSPFSGKQDIGPRDSVKKGKGYYISLHNQDLQISFNNARRMGHAFFPPRSYILQQYFELGHKDASRFLIKEGLYEIPKPEDTKPMVYESSV